MLERPEGERKRREGGKKDRKLEKRGKKRGKGEVYKVSF